MTNYTAYFNGEWVPYGLVKIDPMDRGFSHTTIAWRTSSSTWRGPSTARASA